MRGILAAFLVALAGPAFAECAAGYTAVTVPLCQLNSTPAPVITSPASGSCTVNTSCSFQITATNTPTSWGASPLPVGMSVNTSTGLISGTPTVTGTTNTTESATNAGGTGTASLALTVNPALASAFYVATNGSDSNAGTLAAPFATLSKAQAAMRASGTILTTYIRAGSYSFPTPVQNCDGGTGITCGIALTSADSGETWSYYPPDGYDSADLTGGSTAFGNGLHFIFNFDHTTNVTIDGLSLHDFQHSGFHSTGGDTNVILKDFIIFNEYATNSNFSAPGGISFYGPVGMTISHGVIHDTNSWGINITNPGSGSVLTNPHIDHMAIWNTCTAQADCSGIYQVDATRQTGTGAQWTNNYIRDANTFATLGSGFGSAMYADDCATDILATGNVITGRNGSNTAMLFHGGRNVRVNNNLIDLSTLGQSIVAFQTTTCPVNSNMDGNQVEHNIVISGAAGGGYNILSGSPPTAPTITANFYHNYGSGTLSSGGNYTDASPTTGDPKLTCWSYVIDPTSPVFSAPVSFTDFDRTWGPPGFVIPQTGTAPSSPHTC